MRTALCSNLSSDSKQIAPNLPENKKNLLSVSILKQILEWYRNTLLHETKTELQQCKCITLKNSGILASFDLSEKQVE